jgi:hypothetical protein
VANIIVVPKAGDVLNDLGNIIESDEILASSKDGDGDDDKI